MHMRECGSKFSLEDTTILDYTTQGESQLLTLEALWIQEMTPSLNTQEDFRNRTLTVKFLMFMTTGYLCLGDNTLNN